MAEKKIKQKFSHLQSKVPQEKYNTLLALLGFQKVQLKDWVEDQIDKYLDRNAPTVKLIKEIQETLGNNKH